MDSAALIPTTLQSMATLTYICLALAVALVIVAVISVINFRRLSNLTKLYNSFMYRENQHGIPIEHLLDQMISETRGVERTYASLDRRTGMLERQINGCFQKIGVVRYNPFEDTGGDLSYAIALLDETNTGFILNGIYNRSGSYTYAKEVENGVSVKHKLSAEELEALQAAINNVPRK